MRVNILLACTECKRRNYATVKNKKNTTGRVEQIGRASCRERV